MTIADRIALELAANAQSLRAPNGPTYYAAPRSVGVSVQSEIVRRLVDRGLLAWAKDRQRVAVITDAGRAALGGDA